MKKIAFVIPWYSDTISGGAEIALKSISKNLIKRGIDLEILTTCIKDSNSNWNKNYYKRGLCMEAEVPVRRFKVKKTNRTKFEYATIKLINGDKNLPLNEQKWYLNEMINCPSLYKYIKKHYNDYSLFVFTPYLFSTTYYGALSCLSKAVLIPCFHDEAYAYLDMFKELYPKVLGMAFYSNAESEFATDFYDLSKVHKKVLGLGIDTDLKYNINNFRNKYKIYEPFILYAGRKNAGKNVDVLLDYFYKYKNNNSNNLKLVLIGGGEIDIPEFLKDDVIDLGFVSIDDKYNAYASSLVLCQPSSFESFSIVLMESWACKRPVLVNEKCLVTTDFVKRSNGGLYFNNYYEFEECVNYLFNNKVVADTLGRQGEKFVKTNFDWDIVSNKYIDFFNELINK